MLLVMVQAVLEFQHGPCIIIYRCENHAVAQQFVAGFPHIRDIHGHQRGYVLHMQSFVVLRTVLQRLVYPLRRHADIRHLSSVHPRVSTTTIADSTRVAIGTAPLCFDLIQWALDEVEMDICCFQKMICDLHFVSDGPYDMCSHVAFIVERLQTAPDARPFVLDELGLGGDGGVGHGVHGGVGVDPLFDFYRAGAVVELVGYVCGLGGYVADLADEGHLVDDLLSVTE